MNNKIKKYLLIVSIIFPILGCSKQDSSKIEDKDIVILYTSDVHCGIEDEIGYSSLSAYKKKLEKDNYVTLMDSGDAISGDFIGAVSKGEYVIDIMNEMGYDSMIFGNHEFDYGMDILSQRINEFKGDILSSNFRYIGNKENKFTIVKPYKVIDYGNKKVGFVGVTTPYSIVDSTPSYFMEDGEYAYSFSNETVTELYNIVQTNIDNCLKDHADFVILLTHLGEGDQYKPYSSVDLINNIKGADVVLDGHSHKYFSKVIKDKEGKDRPLLAAGYKMNNIGQVTIGKDNVIKAELLNHLDVEKDQHMVDFIDKINQKVEETASKVVCTSDVELKMSDIDGVRMTRTRETPIGNLITDAYRLMSEAEISITNGGAIRSNLKSGDITFSDIKALHPFGNTIDVVLANGQEIINYLEFASSKTKSNYYQVDETGKKMPDGESGAFAQVSGLKYTIDTSIPSTVTVDDAGMFTDLGENRRVKDIMVLKDGQYEPINPQKDYLVSSHNYLLEEGGDGATMFKDCPIVKKDLMLDYEILVKYIVDELNGHLKDKYSAPEGRITII